MSVQVCSLLGQTEGERVQEGGGGGALWDYPQEHIAFIRDENKSILLWNSK